MQIVQARGLSCTVLGPQNLLQDLAQCSGFLLKFWIPVLIRWGHLDSFRGFRVLAIKSAGTPRHPLPRIVGWSSTRTLFRAS